MATIAQYFWPQFREDPDGLRMIRKRLSHIMCLLVVVLQIGYATPEILSQIRAGAPLYGWTGFLISPVLLLVLAGFIAHERSIERCATLAILSCYGFAVYLRLNTGLFEPGVIYFAAFPMVAGITIGLRAGISFAFLTGAIYACFLYAETQLSAASVVDKEFAISAAITFSLFGILSCIVALLFIHLMEKGFYQLNEANKQLAAYRNNLETMVDERTETIGQQKEELKIALENEKQANAFQNQLVSVVSHEIRTPLSIIDGTARRLAKRAKTLESVDVEERVNTIRSSVRRLTNLMERTLESAKYSEGKVKLKTSRFDLRSKVEEVIAREQEAAPHHTISADLERVPDTYFGDMTMLDHMFSNVISNAVKYSHSNPVVEVSSEQTQTDTLIRVKDHGIGISKGDLPKIAERFFRASTALNINGTGVGLNLVKQIIADHGGTMTIDSEEGAWTEITLALPLVPTISQTVHDESELAA